MQNSNDNYKEKIKGLGKLVMPNKKEPKIKSHEKHKFQIGEEVELYGYVFKITKITPKKIILRILGYMY